jgi:ADP-ribose pyrophosphatase
MNTSSDGQREEVLLETARFRVVHLPMPNGRPELSRAVIRHPGAVVILPLLPDHCVCLIRNFRVSIGETLIELPAGTCEPEEPLIETARRELIEETGYTAGTMSHVHSFYASPGILDEQMHLFVAEDLVAGNPERMADEQIENLIVPFGEALEMISNRTIKDGKTIAGLLMYKLSACNEAD